MVAFCEAYLGLDNRRGMTLEDALRNKRSINEIVKQLKGDTFVIKGIVDKLDGNAFTV